MGRQLERGRVELRPVVLLMLSSIACATAPAAPPVPPPAPLTGERLGLEPGTPEVEVLGLAPQSALLAELGPAPRTAAVARDAVELAQLNVTPAKPIDFDHWVAIVPYDSRSQGTPVAVLTAGPGGELQVVRASAERVEVRYAQPCNFCGGASVNHLYADECMQKLGPRLFLVPRPAKRLVLGIVDVRCDPRLP